MYREISDEVSRGTPRADVFASPFVDVAATPELVKETIAVRHETHWQIAASLCCEAVNQTAVQIFNLWVDQTVCRSFPIGKQWASSRPCSNASTLMNDPAYSHVGKTVLQVFLDGRYFSERHGCTARDWYLVTRRAFPVPVKYGDRQLSYCHAILCQDVATGAFLFQEPMRQIEPGAALLADAMTRVFDRYGIPRKGVVVHSLIWASYSRLKQLPLGEQVDFPSYDCLGVDFDAMQLSEMARFEDWIRANDLICSFTTDVIECREIVDAKSAIEMLKT